MKRLGNSAKEIPDGSNVELKGKSQETLKIKIKEKIKFEVEEVKGGSITFSFTDLNILFLLPELPTLLLPSHSLMVTVSSSKYMVILTC